MIFKPNTFMILSAFYLLGCSPDLDYRFNAPMGVAVESNSAEGGKIGPSLPTESLRSQGYMLLRVDIQIY